MLRKRKLRNINPLNIDNYNKFLISLDKNLNKDFKLLIHDKNNNENNKINNYDDNNKNNDKIINNENDKEIIDNLLKVIENNFNDNINYQQFTGINNNDILLTKSNNPDTHYEPINTNLNKPILNFTSFKPFIRLKKENNIIQKKKIVIDVEINNISDLIELTEKYKIEKDIEYNINMEILHNIKEHLIELNNMIGMKLLKTSIVDQILYFLQYLHKNNTSGDFMHTVIYGPPGTGKTEIAKIMGKLYSKIGILSNGTFKKVTRSDLVAGYLGQTALKTKDVIKESLGGVLFIDEAYALGNSEKRDSFSKECIDTLCEALSDYKDDLMVIIAGYENELKECFFNYNQGLDSRFTWRFKTDEYKANDLYKIFLKKVNDIGWSIEDNTNITDKWFENKMSYFRFYGRDIETLLAKIKIAHSRRVFCKPENEKRKISLIDLEKGFKLYLMNDDIQKRVEQENLKKMLSCMYV
jgi:SpoVK/Ycf46/Vps4 family AAA+-type ATPase